jgi:hypothetical protein
VWIEAIAAKGTSLTTIASLVPADWDEITPAWMSVALARQHPGAEVDHITAEDELPSTEDVWLRYRASVAHGLALWLATASAGAAWQRPDIAVALAKRYCAAYEDLDTAAALDEIGGD